MPASRVIDVWQPELTELAETCDIDEAMDDRKFEYSNILAREMESLLSRIYGSCPFCAKWNKSHTAFETVP